MACLFYLSSNSQKPHVPAIDGLSFGDKIEHLAAYAILGGLVWRALSARVSGWKQVVAVVAIATLFGVTDEWHQALVGREFCLWDLGSDAIGSAVAAAVLTIRTGGDKNGRRARKSLRSEGQEACEP